MRKRAQIVEELREPGSSAQLAILEVLLDIRAILINISRGRASSDEGEDQ